MVNCKIHSVSIYDGEDNLKEVLYFTHQIFDLSCAASGHKFMSDNGKILHTNKYHFTELKDSDPLGNIHYRADLLIFKLNIDPSNRELVMKNFDKFVHLNKELSANISFPIKLYDLPNISYLPAVARGSKPGEHLNAINKTISGESLLLDGSGDISGFIHLNHQLLLPNIDPSWSDTVRVHSPNGGLLYGMQNGCELSGSKCDRLGIVLEDNSYISINTYDNDFYPLVSYQHIPFILTREEPNRHTFTMTLKYDTSSVVVRA